ncbi:MAG TPA: ankyrin repeat domain-containing protein [Candidatus Hydrogenedentes bacterium]|nr:ankyrin repeat domain-containing protein [Candidatus Hydrogenedentota bacterium]
MSVFHKNYFVLCSCLSIFLLAGCFQRSNHAQEDKPQDLNVLCAGGPGSLPEIFCAVLREDAPLLTKLCEQGADVNQQLASSLILNRNSDVVSSEIKPPEQVHVYKGQTPLHIAAYLNNMPCAEILLNHNAKLDVYDVEGQAPIHRAISYEDTKMLQMLLDHGCPVDMPTKVNETMLSLRTTIFTRKPGFDEFDFRKNSVGQTPLQRASTMINDNTLLFLIEKGANINARTAAGMTALHAAASAGSDKTFEILISKGADINAQSNSGMTPLHVASEREWEGFQAGKLAIIKMLLEKDANRDLKDKNGKTALDYAQESRNNDAMKLLKN